MEDVLFLWAVARWDSITPVQSKIRKRLRTAAFLLGSFYIVDNSGRDGQPDRKVGGSRRDYKEEVRVQSGSFAEVRPRQQPDEIARTESLRLKKEG